VPVVIRREYVPGKVDVTVEGLPAGMTAELLSIASGESKGELLLKASDSVDLTKTKIKIVGKSEGVSNSADAEVAVKGRFSLWMVLAIGFWTALLALGMCLALLAGQNQYLGKSFFAPGRIPLVVVIFGALAAGFVSGTVGQALFYVFLAIGVGKLGFLIGWVLLGALLGWGVSFFIPNLDGKKAALAGLGGGLLGALAFLVLSLAREWLGRFGGAALLGFCIGLMVAVVEVAFRRAWLEVRFSEREVITVNLGPEPVKIGGDSRMCTVWARGASDVALRYWVRDGKVYCEDVPNRREAIVGNGDARAAGGVTVIVRTSNAPSSGGPPPRPAPAVPARPALPVPPPLPRAVPVPAPAPLPPASTAPPPRPAPPAPPTKPSTVPDYDDGLPMPMTPPPPARAGATSILDIDDLLASAPVRPIPKPAAPAAPAPGSSAPPAPAAKSMAPPAAKSIAPPAPKPPAPAVPPAAKSMAPPAAKSMAPPAPKPPAPAAPKPPTPPANPGASIAPKSADADACPTCGRKIAGKPGTRYCMVCDKTF
jgi:hypothetical protein